jgi:hypothetical protein
LVQAVYYFVSGVVPSSIVGSRLYPTVWLSLDRHVYQNVQEKTWFPQTHDFIAVCNFKVAVLKWTISPGYDISDALSFQQKKAFGLENFNSL